MGFNRLDDRGQNRNTRMSYTPMQEEVELSVQVELRKAGAADKEATEKDNVERSERAVTEVLGSLTNVRIFHRNSGVLCPVIFKGAAISMGDWHTVILAAALETNSTLQRVDIHENNIGDVGTCALARVLEKNTTLKALDMHSNAACAAGLNAIGDMLKVNRTLELLNISNQFGIDGEQDGLAQLNDDTVWALGEGLENNHGLLYLYMDSGTIGDAGAYALAEGLRKKTDPGLKNLQVGNHVFRDEGFVSFAVGLKNDKSLERLNLGGDHPAGQRAWSAFARLLKTHKKLMWLNIGENDGSVDKETEYQLEELVEANRCRNVVASNEAPTQSVGDDATDNEPPSKKHKREEPKDNE